MNQRWHWLKVYIGGGSGEKEQGKRIYVLKSTEKSSDGVIDQQSNGDKNIEKEAEQKNRGRVEATPPHLLGD